MHHGTTCQSVCDPIRKSHDFGDGKLFVPRERLMRAQFLRSGQRARILALRSALKMFDNQPFHGFAIFVATKDKVVLGGPLRGIG